MQDRPLESGPSRNLEVDVDEVLVSAEPVQSILERANRYFFDLAISWGTHLW